MATATIDRRRTLHVEECMGTVFTIDIRDPGATWDEAIGEVVAWLHHVDEVFSTYRVGSDISRICRNEISPSGADPLVAEVLELCVEVQRETGGYFSAMHSGRLDPTGLVKGWAIERASDLLREHGSANHAVNGGGDIQFAGEPMPGDPWQVGLVDPFDPRRLLEVVHGRDFAVATSGTAERGAHLVDPFTGHAVTDLASVSVVGRSLTRVDAYATAAFAMGAHAQPWLESQTGYEGLVVAADGSRSATTGLRVRR
ncbi:MAG TPA: FAD:protein FMN transferase [Mycobacteriales bacterium]|nr:FAD:protein FMN transferase [Mycobacteriales bacterium]